MNMNLFKYIVNITMFVFFAVFLFSSCEKEENDNSQREFYVDNNNDGSDDDKDESINIQKIVNENVTADIKYEYFAFNMELYTHLTDPGKYFAGNTNVKYGIEWYYTNRPDEIYFNTLNPNNRRLMNVTIVSQNHYSVIISVFAWDDDEIALLSLYNIGYYALKKAEEQGKTLTSDEKALLKSLEKDMNRYIDDVNAYRGKVYVEIDGKKYYVKSFRK